MRPTGDFQGTSVVIRLVAGNRFRAKFNLKNDQYNQRQSGCFQSKFIIGQI